MPVSKGRKKAKKRPTPPSHKPTAVDTKGPSPTWYVVLMFGLMAVGILVILLNYVRYCRVQRRTHTCMQDSP